MTVQNDVQNLLKELKELDASLEKNIRLRHEYELKISDSEGTYLKILESSHELLADIKKESLDYESDLSK